MSNSRNRLTLGIAILLGGLAGIWIAKDIISGVREKKQRDKTGGRPSIHVQYDAPNAPTKASPDHASRKAPRIDEILFGVAGERVVRFDNEEDYRKFLASLDGNRLRLLGTLDRLRAARVGYDNRSDLDALLGENGDSFSNFRVEIPYLGDNPDQQPLPIRPDAVGFGGNTLEWLGITGDNSSWGQGVKIAMLDTGISSHATFPEGVREIDLITGDGPPIDLHGHGTQVASLLIGADQGSRGIAPGAELLSIRIADNNGTSNSFLLAEGIMTAVDAGAQIINISMGSYGDSPLVRDAVAYANENSVVIVAAAGNESFERPAYPAAYESVVAVGAVDAANQHLAFSNTGDQIDLGAPGLSIATAALGDGMALFTGTSAATPIVAATLAATISELGPFLPEQAVSVVSNNLNAAGAPGDDPQFGAGIVDVGRVMNTQARGVHDLAVASNWYEPPVSEGDVGSLLVTIENRGTELSGIASLDIEVGDSIYPMTVRRLQPGETHVLTLPINEPTTTESIAVRSVLNLDRSQDSKLSNNSLSGRVVLIDGSDPGEGIPAEFGGPEQGDQ